MKITEARAIVTSPGCTVVTLKVVAEDGVHGIGDAALNGREPAVARSAQYPYRRLCLPATRLADRTPFNG